MKTDYMNSAVDEVSVTTRLKTVSGPLTSTVWMKSWTLTVLMTMWLEEFTVCMITERRIDGQYPIIAVSVNYLFFRWLYLTLETDKIHYLNPICHVL